MHEHYAGYYERNDLRTWRRLGGRDKADNVRRLWGRRPPPAVVEIGCGDGAIAEALADGFFRSYEGLDISVSGVAAAREKKIPGANFEVFDGVSVPAADRAFDLALLSHVIEHVEDPRALLKEAARVAAHVVVEVPLEYNLRTPRNFQWTETGHINLYSPKLLRHLLQSIGLVIETEVVTCPSRATFVYRKGKLRGAAAWLTKTALLRASPSMAARLLTYHGATIASPRSRDGG